MLPIDATLIETSDYLHTATDLHVVVAGNSKLGWHPKVRGAADDGAEVVVAWYALEYALKADATKRARQMLGVVKALRR